ncbi:hypothetical protein EW145_g2607 [Phellinidium pouzarii]|uniref:Protein FRA10AC1 n=1 Tax=Phellinidium pouzarii TaxID=167371 RepID=A0A4S4LAP0_9AGAM|nr:hypothetical protein EW145_g2607 [Phellinidium pouzarii]
MSLYKHGSSSRLPERVTTTEFDVLKASHQFLRDDDDAETGGDRAQSWEDQLAKKYYDNLYREFAVCDLKHYKSGNFALRWRTEAEVLAGAGETTCANTRCRRHAPSDPDTSTPLLTVELPFVYDERGTQKAALVKVVLCDTCLRKLMWKREKEKALKEGKGKAYDDEANEAGVDRNLARDEDGERNHGAIKVASDSEEVEHKRRGNHQQYADGRRRRNSRSLSPSGRRQKSGREHSTQHRQNKF